MFTNGAICLSVRKNRASGSFDAEKHALVVLHSRYKVEYYIGQWHGQECY